MTTPTHTTIRLDDPGELIAALPHLLGFQPSDSLVLVTRHGRGEPLGPTVRADLPAAEEADALFHHLADVLVRQHVASALAVVIGREHPPGRALIETLGVVLDARGVELGHAYRIPEIASGARWCCYGPDRCGGALPDPGSSRLAAAGVLDGEVTFTSRAELESLLEPDAAEALSRRRAALDQGGGSAPRSARAGLKLLLAHIQAAGSEAAHAPLGDGVIVALLAALAEHRVRDAVLWPGPHAEAAERLWLTLTRAAPAPERAEPACLLGLCAYLRGNGALGNIALRAAGHANPDHRLTQLLGAATGQAIAPGELGELVRTASLHARAELLGTDAAAASNSPA
jgi:hypothetical protein